MTHTQKFLDKKAKEFEQTEKKCIKCGQIKSKNSFTTDRKKKDGKYPICNQCKAIIQNRLYYKYPDNFYKSLLRWINKNPEKHTAHQAIQRAKKKASIVKPSTCEICHRKTDRLDAHHWHGYDKEHWLDVQWLCHKCHNRLILHVT